jgi:hypothetical protein
MFLEIKFICMSCFVAKSEEFGSMTKTTRPSFPWPEFEGLATNLGPSRGARYRCSCSNLVYNEERLDMHYLGSDRAILFSTKCCHIAVIPAL